MRRGWHWWRWRILNAYDLLRGQIELKGWCLVLPCDPEPCSKGAPVVGPLLICKRCGHFVRVER